MSPVLVGLDKWDQPLSWVGGAVALVLVCLTEVSRSLGSEAREVFPMAVGLVEGSCSLGLDGKAVSPVLVGLAEEV